ncbi:hypothetical protein H310_11938 [Aphanomyces invadans]|uniref:Heterokaryon incompatibility domain-containing protein n=1 Tax=Aphanomyces invadans TaxID=157072 RepID=A0A024TJU5_9STRA|nr:hypothetical protein H310_11938 [Aphanomyces invadans]ETV94274.1 hypothetical protein H310_11938 [Aphanomyces invadans]|eukprot:XP_008877036.1 hypothetical protein H310_11938 [Aphanomyces invadans]
MAVSTAQKRSTWHNPFRMLHNVAAHVKGWFTKRPKGHPQAIHDDAAFPLHVDQVHASFPPPSTNVSPLLSPTASSVDAPHTLPKAKVRLVVRVDDRTIHCTRVAVEDLCSTHHFALSHRWQERSLALGCESFTVRCDNEPPYAVPLTQAEARQLSTYIATLMPTDQDNNRARGIWLDYVCMNPTSGSDIAAQMNLFGAIFATATTIPTSDGLDPVVPTSDEYFVVHQERHFGHVRFVWSDMDKVELHLLMRLATNAAARVPGLTDFLPLIDMPYTLYESWRLIALEKLVAVDYPTTATLCRHMLQLAQEPRTVANQRDLAITALRIRELIPCFHEVDPATWQQHLFATGRAKDLLFHTWAVPLHLQGLDVPYDRPDRAWDCIATHFPDADYGYYAPHDAPQAPYGGSTSFANIGFAPVRELVRHMVHNTVAAAAPAVGSTSLVTHSWTYRLAWDMGHVAVAWDVKLPHQTFHFVASHACLLRGVKQHKCDKASKKSNHHHPRGSTSVEGSRSNADTPVVDYRDNDTIANDVDEDNNGHTDGRMRKFVVLVARLRRLGAAIAPDVADLDVAMEIKRQMERIAIEASGLS